MTDKQSDVPEHRSLTATVIGSVAGGAAGAVATQVTNHLLSGRKPKEPKK
jgi:hypothetical protein